MVWGAAAPQEILHEIEQILHVNPIGPMETQREIPMDHIPHNDPYGSHMVAHMEPWEPNGTPCDTMGTP